MSRRVTKCVILLSDKSSGSSALQRHLCQLPTVRTVSKTRHFEFETLYWVKAASVLGLPQKNMPFSEVPIPPAKARRDLRRLLTENAVNFVAPRDDRELVFEGWRQLCLSHQPVFFEKSPHHVHQVAALELIRECTVQLPDIQFMFIGLVRNPMDTLYSMWERWRLPPEIMQHYWLAGVKNLYQFANLMGERTVVTTYETMVASAECLAPVYDFIGVRPPRNDFRQSSILKWKQDPYFGFSLSEDVKTFAQGLGYSPHVLSNEPTRLWPYYQRVARINYQVYRCLTLLPRVIKRRINQGTVRWE